MPTTELKIAAVDGRTLDVLLNRIIDMERRLDKMTVRVIEQERQAAENFADATPSLIDGKVIVRVVDMKATARFFELPGAVEVACPPELKV